MSINRVVLVGNLTRDPELRSTPSGLSVLKMGMAFNDRRRNQESGDWEEVANFIDVTMFGNRADAVSRIVKKGMRVGVDGKLRWRQWESQSGEKRSAIEVIADDIQFLDARDGGQAGAGQGEGSKASFSESPVGDLEGEEIPF